MCTITETDIRDFELQLIVEEKAKATIEKYGTAIRKLMVWLENEELTKQKLLKYREFLLERKMPQTVNGDLSAIHAYLKFKGIEFLKVKFIKVQRQAFLEENKELSEAEYKRLLAAAKEKRNERLYLLMMTLGGTGIRVSELLYITVEAVKHGRAQIHMKGKCRTVLIPQKLCKKLLCYSKRKMIKEGYIFQTKSGRPLDRTNIGHEMKKLCEAAKVLREKVFPHNFRHLFARTFFAIEKNLAHLADVLGHSRVETTRIYVAVSATAHENILKRMKLVI